MTPPPKLAIGIVFTACAGYIDAVGLLQLGGYFVSFMSGNTTQLGAGLADGRVATPVLPLCLIVMFFAGSFAGSLIALSSRRWGSAAALALVLLVIIVSIGLAQVGFSADVAMLALAMAGGAQNAVLPSRGAVRLGATFVSGTLFSAGQDLARALVRHAPKWRWAQHLLVWAALCAGAIVGATANTHWGIPALLAPAGVYCCFLVAFLLRGPDDAVVPAPVPATGPAGG